MLLNLRDFLFKVAIERAVVNSFLSNFSDKIRKGAKVDYKPGTLFPILRADQIIPSGEVKNYHKKIKNLVNVPDAYYDMYYRELINNYIEFVQVLPVNYGEPLGGLIQAGLRHGYMALKLLFDTEKNPPTPLYIYAVFSVALLADSVHVMRSQKTMISHEDGRFVAEWSPFNGSMIGMGDYYKLREFGQVPETLVHAANPILATKILPDKGMSWLSSDTNLLDMWLAVLAGHEDWAGGLGHLIKLMKLNIRDAAFEAIIGLVPLRFLEESELTEDAEALLEWLKEELEEENIKIDEKDGEAFMLEEGMVFDWEKIYERFAAVYSKSPGAIQLGTQFNHLGLGKLSGLDFAFGKVFGQKEAGTKGRKLGFLGGREKGKGSAKTTAEGVKETKTFAESVAAEKATTATTTTSTVSTVSSTPSQDAPAAVLINPQILYTGQTAPPAVGQGLSMVSVQMALQSQLHQQGAVRAQKQAQQDEQIVRPTDSK